MKRSIKHFKSIVFILRQTRVLAYFLFATSILRTAVLYFRLALLNATAIAWPRPLHNHVAHTSLRVGEEAAETIWRAVCVEIFFRFPCNIQTLFYWERKGELYTSYHIRLIF